MNTSLVMNGLIALLGSGEYLPVMDEVDRYLLANCGSKNEKPRVVCLPTAAGQEGDASISRWSKMGIEHFQRLGANVQAVPIIDSESADDPRWESVVENANLIYFSGGNPAYLYKTMNGSRVWAAAQKAWTRGAVYAGCSAGAMILSQQMPGFRTPGQQSQNAFGILPVKFTIPHFDAIPGMRIPLIFALRQALKDGEIILGIDEMTALIDTLRAGGEWKVMGASNVHIFTRADEQVYKDGEKLLLPK